VYGWADGVGDACSTNGEAAMYGGTNTPEPCSPVDYAVTHQMCLVLWTWRKLADETNAKNAPKIC